jgi:parvulin-like peptidyl-prolyl isomerase
VTRTALITAIVVLAASPPLAHASAPAAGGGVPPGRPASRATTATAGGLPVVNLANVAALDLSRLPRLPDGRRIVARVNGRPVLEQTFSALLQDTVASQDAGDPQRVRALEQVLAPQVLDRLILAEVMRDYAAAVRLRVSEAEVDRAIEEANRALPGGRKMEDAIVQGRKTRESLREAVRIQLLERKVADHVTSAVVESDAGSTTAAVAAMSPGGAAPGARPVPAGALGTEVRLSRIFIRCPDGSDTSATESAHDRATEALLAVQEGMDFAEAARRFSEDRRSSGRGGDIGYMARGSGDPMILREVESFEVGEVSGVVRVAGGFCVVKVTERHEGTRRTDALRGARTAEYEKWCRDALKRAAVERFL